MAKTTTLKFLYFLVAFFMVSHIIKTEAQIVIGTPELQFTQACANESFNSFAVNFVFNPETGISSSNQFMIEMSDPQGDFSESTIVFTSNPGAISTSPAYVNFSLPTITAGEGYKIRIKSTHPATYSTPSNPFSAYYKLQDSPFTINDFISTSYFCPGGSFLLTIDNPGSDGNDSPLKYPSLTFNWFKEIDPTTSVFVAKGNTLSVTEEGVYFAETDYGSCTSDSFSNRVTVLEATSEDDVYATITSSLGNPFCGADGPTTLTTVPGNSYQWFKEGSPITGATNQSYETAVSGSYSVVVTFVNCEATGTIDLQSGGFESSINVPANNMLEAGDVLVVTVTTNAINPVFEWLLNGEVIPNATQATYNVTEFGSYVVLVTQTSECNSTNSHPFEVEEFVNPFPEVDNIPNVISPNGDGINDTWVIPTSYVTGSNTEVIIYSSRGDMVFSSKDYENNWPEGQLSNSSVNQVFYYMIIPQDLEPKKGSITIIK